MLIFESQREARVRTLRLLLAFGVAVLLLVVLVNAALALAWGLTWSFWVPGAGYPHYFFEVNTAVTLLFVLGVRSLPMMAGLPMVFSFGVFHVFYYWLKVPLPIGAFGI